MSVLEWPADLTDLRPPPAWDGRPVDWHGWHPPIEARTLFLCENNGLRRDPQPLFRLRAPVPTLVKPRIDGRRAHLHHHRTLRVLQHDHRTRDRAGRDKRMDVG